MSTLAPERPLVPAVVPFSRPPQLRAAIRATVETTRAARGIGVNVSKQEQGPAGRSLARAAWAAVVTLVRRGKAIGALAT